MRSALSRNWWCHLVRDGASLTSIHCLLFYFPVRFIHPNKRQHPKPLWPNFWKNRPILGKSSPKRHNFYATSSLQKSWWVRLSKVAQWLKHCPIWSPCSKCKHFPPQPKKCLFWAETNLPLRQLLPTVSSSNLVTAGNSGLYYKYIMTISSDDRKWFLFYKFVVTLALALSSVINEALSPTRCHYQVVF